MAVRGKRSEWCGVYIESDTAQKACKSWFGGMIDDCTVLKAEILTDIDTDREKKIRARARRPDGREYLAERTLGRKQYTVKLKPLRAAAMSEE